MIKKRTRGMTTIGVLNIIFGGIGIIASLYAIIMIHAVLSRLLTGGDEALEFMKNLFIGIFGLSVSVVGLIAGIGVLRLASWGRLMSLMYAGLWALYSVVS